MKFDFNPQSDEKVKLFAHWGEAIVFWLSLSALVFLAIVTTFRYFYLRNARIEFSKLDTAQKQILEKVEQLEVVTDKHEVLLDTLSVQARDITQRVEQIRTELETRRSQIKSPASGEPTSAPTQPPGRSRRVLEEFQIKPSGN